MNLTTLDLQNIYPALMIAVKSPATNPPDMRIWLELMAKIEVIIKEVQNNVDE